MRSDEQSDLAGGSLVKRRQEITLQLRRARLCSNVGLLASSNAYGVRITTRYLRVKCWKRGGDILDTKPRFWKKVLQTISHRLILRFTSTLSLFSSDPPYSPSSSFFRAPFFALHRWKAYLQILDVMRPCRSWWECPTQL